MTGKALTGKALLKRIAFTTVATAGLFVILAALRAEATPIRPDIRKLVSQPDDSSAAQFMPARAGWDGPEMPRRAQSDSNSALDASAVTRANRAALLSAATPDLRALLGIAAIIFLLRRLKRYDRRQLTSAPQLISIAPHGHSPDRDQLTA